jgi:hypothetical protein
MKKSEKYAGLAQENSFSSAKLHSLWCRVQGAATLRTCRKGCNKYDLTASQCFLLPDHNDWSKWFVISTPQPICCSSFSFIGGVYKSK